MKWVIFQSVLTACCLCFPAMAVSTPPNGEDRVVFKRVTLELQAEGLVEQHSYRVAIASRAGMRLGHPLIPVSPRRHMEAFSGTLFVKVLICSPLE